MRRTENVSVGSREMSRVITAKVNVQRRISALTTGSEELRRVLAAGAPVLGSADACECAEPPRIQECLQRRGEDSVRVMTVFLISQSLASAISQA